MAVQQQIQDAEYFLEIIRIKYTRDEMRPNTFRKEAKSKNNQEALKFIDFFDNEFKNLKNESVVKLLFEKRNITIHRTSPSVRGEIQATITEKISISESVRCLPQPVGKDERFC